MKWPCCAYDRKSLGRLRICRVELDPGDWNGNQPIIETLHRHLQRDVEVYMIYLSWILPVLRNKAKMRLAERLKILHRNANLIIWRGSMDVFNLYYKEARDVIENVVEIVEQYLLVPLWIDIPLHHE